MFPVLTHLTCASLTEDTYGTVQKDIPRILEALLTFLSAVEEYQAEIDAKYKVEPLTSDEVESLSGKEVERRVAMEIEVGKAGEMLSDISGGMFSFTLIDQLRRGSTFTNCVFVALKDGISRIVRTFGDKLLAFKFPPRVARKLQGFIDYN